MPMYMCRWPGGFLSFVWARSEDDASIELDEWGNTDNAELTKIKDFSLTFRLTDEGDLVLSDIGEATHDTINDAFPGVFGTVASVTDGGNLDLTDEGRKEIKESVDEARNRPVEARPGKVKTRRGRLIQKHLRCSAAYANQFPEDAPGSAPATGPVTGHNRG